MIAIANLIANINALVGAAIECRRSNDFLNDAPAFFRMRSELFKSRILDWYKSDTQELFDAIQSVCPDNEIANQKFQQLKTVIEDFDWREEKEEQFHLQRSQIRELVRYLDRPPIMSYSDKAAESEPVEPLPFLEDLPEKIQKAVKMRNETNKSWPMVEKGCEVSKSSVRKLAGHLLNKQPPGRKPV